jgi:hypothetical protein
MIMSRISSYDDALDFMPAVGNKPPRRGLLETLRLFAEAMNDGLQAERRYYQLTAVHGVAPSEAAAKVFDEHYRGR